MTPTSRLVFTMVWVLVILGILYAKVEYKRLPKSDNGIEWGIYIKPKMRF